MGTEQPPPPAPAGDPSSAPDSGNFLLRIAGIPLVNWALTTVSTFLGANIYTKSSFETANAVFTTYSNVYTTFIQPIYAPIVNVANVTANKTLDIMENMFPVPFKTTPEDVTGFVEQAAPTIQPVDELLKPLVDFLDNLNVTYLHADAAPATTDFQFQRLIAVFTNMWLKLYQMSNMARVVVETNHSIIDLVNSAIQSILAGFNTQLQQIQTAVGSST
ncbi:hypothetical protein R3P38DRAFT_2816002 [Favolaschia claudopus]|uniref:Uncharacterized protein n=1 Tax=Favolaschia claudopus TaxID=2862362 RepID=A0AAV9Z0E5_9AGAR